ARNVFQMDGIRRQQRGGNDGQRRVLVSRGTNRAAEGSTTLDDELDCWHVVYGRCESVLRKYIDRSTLCTVGGISSQNGLSLAHLTHMTGWISSGTELLLQAARALP